MNFEYYRFLPVAIVVFLLFAIAQIVFEKKYFSRIEKYWFYKRTWWSRFSSLFYTLGFGLLVFAVLDLRAPEQIINSNITDQKTIIMIDSSASMLAEDIRPNRFQKSVVLARHFVKKAVGHQISIVSFAGIPKRIIPFTDDIDLLDSRLVALGEVNINRGGTDINQAISDAIQFLKIDAGTGEKLSGNIVVFSDFEDHESLSIKKVPEGVNLAMVGVGTLRGEKLPLRSKKGRFLGYKKFKGKEVVSKLNENLLKKIESEVDNSKYWISLSYSLPTEEILTFFRGMYKKKLSKSAIRIKPALYEYLIVPAVILLILGGLLRLRKTFVFRVFLVGCLMNIPGLSPVASANSELSRYDQLMKAGTITSVQKLKMAELLVKDGKEKRAIILYDEVLTNFDNADAEVLFNYGTACLKNGEMQRGIKTYDALKKKIGPSARVYDKNMIQASRKNLHLALGKMQEKTKQKQKGSKDKKKDKKKQQRKKSKGGAGKGEQKKQKQEKQEKKQDKKKDPGKDKKKKQKQKKMQPQPQSLEAREQKIRRKRKLQKVPALLKKIMDTDRDLQKKYLSTGQRSKKSKRDVRDW